MTSMTFTVSREVEVHVFDIPQDERFVLVHARFKDEKSSASSSILRRADFEKIQRTGQGANKLFNSAAVGKEKSQYGGKPSSTYRIYATSVNREYLERRTTGDGVNDYHNMRELKWGQPMPEDHVVIGFGSGTNFLYDLDGNPIAQCVSNFYLNRDYDIRAMLENEAENPDVAFPERNSGWSDDKVYYVPGNGETLDVSFRLSAEKAREYIETHLTSFSDRSWLEENTVLGKYKRAEPLEDNDDDDY